MALDAIQIIAYLYGREVAERLRKRDVKVEHNKIGRIRYVYVDGKLAFVLRNNDGYLLPTIHGARFLDRNVTVSGDIEYIKQGRNVPAKYVQDVSRQARPNGEVTVLDTASVIIAVGRLLYSRKELTLRRGYAVKVRESLGRVNTQQIEPLQ